MSVRDAAPPLFPGGRGPRRMLPLSSSNSGRGNSHELTRDTFHTRTLSLEIARDAVKCERARPSSMHATGGRGV